MRLGHLWPIEIRAGDAKGPKRTTPKRRRPQNEKALRVFNGAREGTAIRQAERSICSKCAVQSKRRTLWGTRLFDSVSRSSVSSIFRP